ncbi:CBS domain-containing protein [Peterkaempfera griseoplana]|uniref:CBS domain-containing protein n=1 Tax=Peterkaempfera griseoplana TaxID=66896 RepID=UPI0006E3241E|nr:CBS domain-containing protein [Peterkaempfera griseoplana]
MATQVCDVMTRSPVAVAPQTPVIEAAQRMRDENIGAVLVTEGDELQGLVTDRDLAVRVLAEGGDIAHKTVQDACSADLVAVRPDDDIDQAIQLMRDKAIRRLPVVEGGQPVGIISLGDLALERDPHSALGDISDAEPNR